MSDHEHDYHIHESYPYNYVKEYDGDDAIVIGAIWICTCGAWKQVKYSANNEEIV